MPTESKPDEKDILAQNESLRGEVTGLNTRLTEANAALTTARERITSLEASLNTATSQVTAAERRATDAEARAKTAEDAVKAKDGEIDTLKASSKTAAQQVAEAGIVNTPSATGSEAPKAKGKTWTERCIEANTAKAAK